MGRRGAALAPVLALAIVAAAVAESAAAGVGAEKCGGCTPCVGADCPVVYPSPSPPALPPPPPYYYYYSPPPPASYPYPGGSADCTPPGKGPLYLQDPGFMPSGAPRRAVAASVAAFAALAGAWAFL